MLLDGEAIRQPFTGGTAIDVLCRYAMDRCKVERPLLADAGASHQVACWLNEGTGRPSAG
jgi:peptide/nickel transport system ATP-binding protein/oligopeptide transport system ATP-binding protein